MIVLYIHTLACLPPYSSILLCQLHIYFQTVLLHIYYTKYSICINHYIPILLKPLFKPAITVTHRFFYLTNSTYAKIPHYIFLHSIYTNHFRFFFTNFHTIIADTSAYTIKNPLKVLFIACYQTYIICIQKTSLTFLHNQFIPVHYQILKPMFTPCHIHA